MREAAAHGYDFLANRMWDRQHGGYVWEVDESGARVADASKVVYGLHRGPLNEDAREREKIWWVQAEGLMSALTMYTLTREPQYAQVFEGTLRWVSTRQTDWRSGEWFAEVRPDGSTARVKGDRWKEGYHNGRALIESIRLIGEL